MSRRMKVLAALNVLGWVVAVPLLLVAVVDPFVDFGDWPDRLIGDRRGDVQLRTPEAPAQRAEKPKTQVKSESTSSDDNPLRAAREALERFRPPATSGAVPLAGGGVGTGGGLRGQNSPPRSGSSPIGESGPGSGGRVNGPAPTAPAPIVP